MDDGSVHCHYHWISASGVKISTITSVWNADGEIQYWYYVDYFASSDDGSSSGGGQQQPGLTASRTGNTVILTLNAPSHTGDWHYTYTYNPTSACSDAVTEQTATVNGLQSDMTYTFTAYGDSGCQTELASATISGSATSQVVLTHSSVAHNSATLTLSNHSGNWWRKHTTPAGGTCADAGSGSTADVTGLSASTSYIFAAYSNSDCSTILAETGFTTSAAPALDASSVTHNSATLTLSNHSGNWWHKHTTPAGGTCADAGSGATASVTGLNASTSYTFAAYNDNTCSTKLAETGFTTSAAPAQAALAHSSVTHYSATLTLSNYSGNWWHKHTTPAGGTCADAGSGTAASVTGLNASTSYTFAAYSDNNCSADMKLAETSFTTSATPVIAPPKSLSASDITATTATLTIGNHTGNWYYKSTETNATCSSEVTTTEANLTGLTKNTRYTFKAYSNNGCTSSSIATAPAFTTATPRLAVSSVTDKSAKLTLSGWNISKDGKWWHKHGSGNCSSNAITTSSDNVTGLTANTSYTYTAYSDSGCNTSIAAAQTFTTRVAPIVSNLSETDSGFFAVGRYPNNSYTEQWAVGFTTGSNTGGYTLNSIAAKFGDKVGNPGNITAAIYDNYVASQGKNRPWGQVSNATFSGPARPDGEVAAYTCSGSGCALSANTPYHLVFTASASANNYYKWQPTSSDAESNNPVNAGWAIEDYSSQRRRPSIHWIPEASTNSGLIAVYATSN